MIFYGGLLVAWLDGHHVLGVAAYIVCSILFIAFNNIHASSGDSRRLVDIPL